MIRTHEKRQQLRVEAAVGMGHQCPGNAINAGIARQHTFGQLGQFPIITFGQVDVDIADLLFDHMKIIQEPFRRRRDGMLLMYRLGNVFIGIEQHPAILAHPRDQISSFLTATDLLRFRQTHCMLF